MLMSLGMFGFELATLPFQDMSRDADWRHGSSPRFGARPASQYLGPGDETVNLSGVLLPGVAGTASSLDTLKQMADQGEAWPLVDGTGQVHGAFAIGKVSERHSTFVAGGLARRIEFTIELKRVS